MNLRPNRPRIAKATRPVTLKTVANHTKLAAGTVSSILNRTPQSMSIPQPTRDRVFAAAQELRYQPNPFARALKIGHVSSGARKDRLTAGSRALVFEGDEHFRQAMNAIRLAGLPVPHDASGFAADDLPA
jgi:DNA-binding LacI/PurR family transcriptional regulator